MRDTERKSVYFEDIELGEPSTFGEHLLTREAIVEFARTWDPQPFHIDDEAARGSVFGGLGSRPDAGIAMSRVELLNQNDEVIVDSISAALIAMRREPPQR